LDGIPPSLPERLCHAAIRIDGRVGLYHGAKAGGRRLHQSRLHEVCAAVYQAVRLLLGRVSEGDPTSVDERSEELTLSRVIGADVLGLGARFAVAQAGSLAAVLASITFPGGILRGLSGSALPASDRARDDHPVRVLVKGNWEEDWSFRA